MDIVVGSDDSNVYFIDGLSGNLLYVNSDPLKSVNIVKLADLTGDGILDVVAGSFDSNVYFIDGSNGATISVFSDPLEEDGPIRIAIGNLNDDNIPDIIIGSYDFGPFDPNLYFIDGATLKLMFTSSIPGWVSLLEAEDFNLDGIDDIVVIPYFMFSPDDTVSFIDGSTGELLFNNTITHESIRSMVLKDINGDNIRDVIIGAQDTNIYALNGKDGRRILINTNPTDKVDTIGAIDFEDDGTVEIIAVAQNNHILIINSITGKTEFEFTIDEEINHFEKIQLQVNDFTGDDIADLLLFSRGWSGIYIFDSQTWKQFDVIETRKGISSNIMSLDFDRDGKQDIVFGDTEGRINILQSIQNEFSLFPTIITDRNITQSSTLISLEVILVNNAGEAINDASVTLIAKKATSDLSISLISMGVENASRLNPSNIILNSIATSAVIDGTYEFSFTTENWEIGQWNIYPIIDNPPYDSVLLDDYVDINGNYLSLNSINVIGQAIPSVLLSSSDSVFLPEIGVIEKVVEGSVIDIEIELKDTFSHLLDGDDANITINFHGNTYIANTTETGTFIAAIHTDEVEYGGYNIELIIDGPFLLSSTHTYKAFIIPQSPNFEISQDLMLQVFGISLVIFYILISYLKWLYNTIKVNPDKTKRRTRFFTFIIFLSLLFSIGYGIWIFQENTLNSFIIVVIAFWQLLVIYFLWLFLIIYNRVLIIKFSLKIWRQLFFFIFSAALLLSSMFFIATQIPWFDYLMSQSQQEVIFITIPSIIWEIGFVSFVTGFILVILVELYENYNDIKYLNRLQREIEQEYYPKQPNKLADAIADIAQNDFKSLLKSFMLWYIIIIVSFISSFQFYQIIPILLTVIGSSLLSGLVIFRKNVVQVFAAIK
ncbi:MAG: hypothetical protein ACXAD7_15305 [Candidatus Kariarchaeaceae archaeon]